MARQRLVKPDLFQHSGLHRAELGSALPLIRAYIGLWCQADRRGCFEWRPDRLKLNVCPFDTLDFEDVLNALESAGFIVAYVVEGRKYGYIPTLVRHQTFHHKELANPLIPDPPFMHMGPGPSGAYPRPTPDQPRVDPTVVSTVVNAVTDAVAVTANGRRVAHGTANHQVNYNPPAPDPTEVVSPEQIAALKHSWRSRVGPPEPEPSKL